MDFAGESQGQYLYSGFGSTDQEDLDRGMRLLNQYHDNMKRMYPSIYKLSITNLIEFYQKQTGGRQFPMPLGLAANVGGVNGPVSDYVAGNAMYTLAVKGKGRIPNSFNSFTSVLSDTASDPWSLINFTDALVYTAQESGSDVADAVVDIGDTILNTGKAANAIAKFLPLILVGGFGLFLWTAFKKREELGEKIYSAAGSAASAAGSGLYGLAGDATKRASKAILGNPKRRR